MRSRRERLLHGASRGLRARTRRDARAGGDGRVVERAPRSRRLGDFRRTPLRPARGLPDAGDGAPHGTHPAARAGSRSGPPCALASPHRRLADRADRLPRVLHHPRLRGVRPHRILVRGGDARALLPGRARRSRGLRAAAAGGDLLVARGVPPPALRVMVGDPPVPLPGARAGVRPPDPHGCFLHLPPTHAIPLDSHLGSGGRRRRVLSSRAATVAQPAAPAEGGDGDA